MRVSTPPLVAALKAPSHREVLEMAWPIVLANTAVPLLGLVDTAVIGNTGDVVGLGAIALGALVFNFVYWSFAFLRMGTTGFVAQASGAGDEPEVRAALGRALLLGATVGIGLLLLQRPIELAALRLLGGSDEVESLTAAYFRVRIWGAPASLTTFAILGTFVGLGESRRLLFTQVVLNGLNIVLDVTFAGFLGLGVVGIAWGTVLAEWAAMAFALWLVVHLLRRRAGEGELLWSWRVVLHRRRLWRTLSANADIMIRTLFLLFGFGWFVNRGAGFGDVVLAANHVLLQMVGFCAYFLDGCAYSTEVLVGRAIGARARASFDGAVRVSSELAALTAVALGVVMLVAGPSTVRALTDLDRVRETALAHLPWAALYVALSAGAYQLDGVFIGSTRTSDMRNTGIVSFVALVLLSWMLVGRFGNLGLWWAWIGWVVVRALALGTCYPRLRRSIV